MRRIRIIHRLRITLALLGFLVVTAAGAGLWWANQTGLPESWRDQIEDSLAAHGLHAEVGSMRLSPLRGIEASDVVLFTDHRRTRKLARLQQLVINVDRSKLSRGEVRIERIDLVGGGISLPIDPDNPNSKALEIQGAEGRMIISGERAIELTGASGNVGGIRLECEARMLTPRPQLGGTEQDIEEARKRRREALRQIIDGLEAWLPESTTAPLMKIKASGDLDDPKSLRAKIAIHGSGLQKQGILIDRLDVEGELRGTRLVMDRVEALTAEGSLSGRIDYELMNKTGQFEARSDLDAMELLRDLDLVTAETPWSLGDHPSVETRGSFAATDKQWKFKLSGHAELENPEFRTTTIDRLVTDFSFDGSRTYLQDLEIVQGNHQLTGRVLISAEQIRYQAATDLPLPFWQKIIPFEPLKKVLDDFAELDDSKAAVNFEGTVDPRDKHAWTFRGTAAAENLSYRGVPARKASVTLDLNYDHLDFSNGEVTFDYRDYPLRKAHGGPLTGSGKADRITFHREAQQLDIIKVRGKFWPAPLVRTFAPKIADHLESYRFHDTPTLQADGKIGVLEKLGKQDLRIDFSTTRPTNYEFLDADLTLQAPQAAVRVINDQVRITKLQLGALGGKVRGTLTSRTKGKPALTGEFDWTRVSLPALARAYDFETRPPGELTGRIDFIHNGDAAAGLNGGGLVALEQGELFSVPIFGPLSKVISVILGKKKAGFQEAQDAFCTFSVKNGVFSTNDFLTTTSSMVFTGDAVADINTKQLEMTVRMNARGLFSLITIPLRPFYGMFQFRGTGPISDPEWKNVMFTSPPESQKILLDPPKARAINSPGSP